MPDTEVSPTRIAGRGVAGGAAAWALGYLVVYVTHADRIENSLPTGLLGALAGEDVTWKLVGWIHFNAHNVAVRAPGLFGETSRNFVAGADDPLLTALFALPPVLLALAGAGAAWGTAAGPTTAARNGAAVALGYLPLSVAGAALFAISVGDAAAGPPLVTAALVAGGIYPLAFGAIGGLAGGHLSAR